VLLSVVVRQLETFRAEVLLHERIHNNFFTNGVTSDLPPQLIRPTRLSINISGGLLVVFVIFVHLRAQA
jgi:hypothetical protein